MDSAQIADNLIAQWGAVGVLVVVLITGLVFMYKWLSNQSDMHRAERKEWVDTYKEQSDKSTEAIKNNTQVLSRIEGRLSQ